MVQTFSKSTPKLSPQDFSILAIIVLIISFIYLITSHFTHIIGFPLDDSWIHLTYARNLAQHGEWSFRVGIPSAGSTAPLWSALLAVGFLLNLAPYIWTYFLGILILFFLAVLCEWAVRNLIETYRPRFPWVGIFIAFDWHFGWSALSGMETLLHGLIATTVLILLMTNSPRYLTLGLLAGLSVWIRPDGLTLLAPIAFTIFFNESDMRSRIKAFLPVLIGFGSIFLFYLLFNLAIGGTPMPNTFYAKQAEYEGWTKIPILTRLGRMSLQLFVGASLVLLPGIVSWIVKSIRARMWGSIAAILWCLGYLYLYTSRLPVYQHGRYLMPAMPILFLFGLLAFAEFDKSKTFGRYHWVGQTVWRGSAVMLAFGFLLFGARTYAQDVAIIETEMVDSAKWVAENIPAGEIIAAHDIGALGYFDDHPLIDLAGLITPEVIPFIRDEEKLTAFLNERGADYLIVFPWFYPEIVPNLEVVFVTGAPFTLALGEQNMTVYRWKSP
ncbi:MAG: hypothetical protein KF758_12035 [Anaerolineales bacterium]|nr:hypothetical protein [Anaerolineales bacterium]MBX3037630.1 hypothetical protein [Anaerolineales bacterium]